MAGPAAIPRLSALTLTAIRDATARYQRDGNAVRWERAVQQALARGHQAAFLLGAAERLGVPVGGKLLSAQNLSRAERDQIKAIVTEQLDYLKRFVDVADDLSPEQVAARADLYALGVKQTYWHGWSDADLDCVPGGCEECYGNCRCSLEREDDGIYWRCADDAHSCASCSARAAQTPYYAYPVDVEEVA